MNLDWKRKVQNWMNEHLIESVDFNLVKEALTHSSYKGMGYSSKDNERLEFLGDAALDIITAHQLFLNSQLSEGQMTEMRKELVSNEILADIFDGLELEEIILTANDLPLSVKVKADFVEALVGAVFIDKGYEICHEIWNAFLPKNVEKMEHPDIELENMPEEFIRESLEGLRKLPMIFKDIELKGLTPEPGQLKNAKNTLQEYCQKRALPVPEYELIEREGWDHRPVFTVKISLRAVINDDIETISVQGKGMSKKKAEFKAAEAICDKLGLLYSN